MGAWIEIVITVDILLIRKVAPLVGAWIEIFFVYVTQTFYEPSLPSWERGLK